MGCLHQQGSDGIYHLACAHIFVTSFSVSVVSPSKTGLVTTAWDRLFFFTQGGNLMCQPRGAVAGGMVLDLDNSSVMAVDCEDRRYCFQITSPSGKTCANSSAGREAVAAFWVCLMSPPLSRSMILQAESKKEYEEVSLKEVNSFTYSYSSGR